MSQPSNTTYQQGDTSPAEYLQNKKKSNKMIGLALTALVFALVGLSFIL